MLRYREIIEMRSIGLSLEKVAFLCGCNAEKVQEVVSRASMLGLEWPVPIEFSEGELQRLLDPQAKPLSYQPDCPAIFNKLLEEGYSERLTKKHAAAAWVAYLRMAEEDGSLPYVRNRFQEIYARWHKRRSTPLCMRVNWTPAEEIQVDWAGSTLTIYDKESEQTPAYLFVATSPYSDYTFVRASLDMSMQSWLKHHRHMFEFFGGVPLFLAPDNLRTGVSIDPKTPFKDESKKKINPKYQELADYYGTIVMPTRVRSPRDKGAVESHVNIAAGRIIGFLSHLRFTSIDQLNYAISELMDAFNEQPMQYFHASRKDIFQEEKPFFAPLPDKPFNSVTWQKCTASSDAVVRVRGVYYGIPEKHANQKVDVRISDDFVDVFTSSRKQMLAHHVRRPDGSETFEGFAGRRPDRFKPLSEWADQNDRQALLDQWHPTKNSGLTPHDVVCRSLQKVWWRCTDCGYEWQETPRSRTRRKWDDCLACANIDLIPGKNDLATLLPDVAAEWHPTKNGCLPSEVFPDHQLLVWWISSECGHEWSAPIDQRTTSHLGRLCPYCSGKKALFGFNDVATLCPELAKLWHPTKNRERKPEGTSVCSSSNVYLWNGPLTDIWMESPRAWMLRNGYKDVIRKFEALAETARNLDKQNTSSDNHMLTREEESKRCIRRSRFSQHWGQNLSLEEWCLRYSRPDILDEWHSTKNGDFTPKNVACKSNKTVWWRCSSGHEWQSTIYYRTMTGRSCPICKRKNMVYPGANDLASCKPNLLTWLSSENGELNPSEISDRSVREVKWKCPHCGAEWQQTVRGAKGDKIVCPSCGKGGDSNPCFVKGLNDLASRHPRLAAEWHPAKNGELSPKDISPGSNRKVWWRCKRGHEWQSAVATRSSGSNCPYCENKALLAGFNDLATTRPELAREWHPTKNEEQGPNSVMAGSHKRVWWICECGHEWQATVLARSGGSGCPYCKHSAVLTGFNDLATVHPELAKEWHPAKNGDLRPDSVAAGSHKKVWWMCECGHEWQAEVSLRSCNGTRCPICCGRKVLPGYNDLATKRPEIAASWHPTKNGHLSPKDVTAGSNKTVWWQGECSHEWQAKICDYLTTSRANCPYCTNTKLLLGFNDLATTHPQLASEWHFALNESMTPKNVTASSGMKVWWQCANGHVWKKEIRLRTKHNYGCPYCAGKKTREIPIKTEGSFGIPNRPKIGITLEEWCKYNNRRDLLHEWHPKKNEGLTPKDILAKSNKHVWWRCERGHEWTAELGSRTKGTPGIGCPICANRKTVVGFNDLATTHPELAADWHPEKNGDLQPTDVRATQTTRAWWRCISCGHEWETQVCSRKRRPGCPNCKKGRASD